MLYTLWQWVKLLIGVAVLGFCLFYNPWLQSRYGYSAFHLGDVALGALDCFLWVAFHVCEGLLWHIVLLVLALAAFVILYASNYAESDSFLQSLLMTLWQIMVGLLALGLLLSIKNEHRKK